MERAGQEAGDASGSRAAASLEHRARYWTDDGPQGGGVVMAMPVGAGPPLTLASGLGYPLVVAANGGKVYFAGNGEVMAVPATGATAERGTAVTPASGQAGIPGMAADAANVYLITSDGNVMKVPAGGGAMVTLAAMLGPTAIAIDVRNAYWTNDMIGAVMSVPIGGGTPAQLASSMYDDPLVIAADGANVYWGPHLWNDAEGATGRERPEHPRVRGWHGSRHRGRRHQCLHDRGGGAAGQRPHRDRGQPQVVIGGSKLEDLRFATAYRRILSWLKAR
jgi:hypothetical protein